MRKIIKLIDSSLYEDNSKGLRLLLNKTNINNSEAPTPVSEDVAINETNFPDSAFRVYVATKFDLDGDGYFTKSEIENITDIDLGNYKVTSVEGIRLFSNLETLECRSNYLISLDVSGCTNLETLVCICNDLTSLDVSGCTNLRALVCDYNALTSLDVSGCTNLEILVCNANALTSLDISKNPFLTEIKYDEDKTVILK